MIKILLLMRDQFAHPAITMRHQDSQPFRKTPAGSIPRTTPQKVY